MQRIFSLCFAMASNGNSQQQHLPIDGEGLCMLCKEKPDVDHRLTCVRCFTPWHVACLLVVPETLALAANFECPDCSGIGLCGAPASTPASGGELILKIRAIEADASLTESQKAKRKQQLLSGKAAAVADDDDEEEKENKGEEGKEEEEKSVLAVLAEAFMCAFCRELPEMPVTTPCGHNFCLKCFQKWIGQGKRQCGKCRCSIPSNMVSKPRVNLVLVESIRHAKSLSSSSSGVPPEVCLSSGDAGLPDEPYVTERAKRGGLANAKRGRLLVTTPKDHFGPISSEYDPILNQGILVGQCFDSRHKCGQWGVHLPPVGGISGQEKYGSQSIVLSGGYKDDEDHGEWFIYTGSGGRDLSGNKRTNKDQAFNQEFRRYNQALRVSCAKGYPVRVVRSHKGKKSSSYAPVIGYRYDGIYRIEKCWKIVGMQGLNVCRYLFVRCDNEPAPWTCDELGDQPRPLPTVPELQLAFDIFERMESPSWDYDEVEACWMWKKQPPPSKGKVSKVEGNPEDIRRARDTYRKAQHNSIREQILKGFSCSLCQKVLALPVTTPCAHNFCKSCLQGKFAGQEFIKERSCLGGCKLRSQKNVMKCPCCENDIAEFLQNLQVNTELMDAIEKLQPKADETVKENYNQDSGKHEIDSAAKNSLEVANSSKSMSSAEAEGTSERALKRKLPDTHLPTEQTTEEGKNKKAGTSRQ